MKKLILFFSLLAGLVFSFNKAKATTYTWTGLGGNTNWNNSGNWLPTSGYPNNTSDVAVFTTIVAVQPTLNQSISLNQLNISTPTTLTLSSGFSINFGGTSPQINLTGGTGTISFTGAGTITGSAAITVSNNFTTASAITAANVTINAFTATFNAALNCGSGTITMNSGASLTTNAAGTVGAGALTVSASTVTINSTAAQTYSGAISINGAATLSGTGAIGAASLTMNASAATLNINKTINLSGTGTLTVGSINVNSAGTLNVGSTLNTSSGTTLSLVSGKLTVTGSMTAAGTLNSTGTSVLTTNGSGNTESGTVDVGGSTGSSLTWNAGASGSSTTVMSTNTTAVHSGSSLIIGANNTLTFNVALQILCNNATSYGVVNNGTINMNGNNMYSTVAPSSVNALTNNSTGVVNLTLNGSASGRISLGDYTNISNSGTINCAGNSTYISSGQYSVINNNSTGIINATSYLSYIAMSSTGASVVNSGSIYLSNQSNLTFNGTNSFLTNNAGGLIDVNGYAVYLQFGINSSGTNAGTINALQQGAITLQGNTPCTLSNSGTINVGTAATSGGTFNIYGTNAAFTNTGSFIVRNSGACNIASNNNVNTFTNNGGTVTVNGTTFNWGTNGSMTSATGTIAMSNGATFNLSGSSASLTNGGSFTVAGSTVNLSGGSSSISNSGTVDVSAATNFYLTGTSATLSTSGTFNIAGVNSGSYTNVNLNGTSNTFTNTGSVNASNYAAFNLNSSSATLTNSGPFGLAASTILLFGGSATLNNNTATGVITVSGGGSITTTTGPINNTLGTITLNTGSLTINSSGTLTSSGTFTVASGSTFSMTGGTSKFINSGAFSMTSATFIAGNDVAFTNSGTSSTMVITNTDLPFTGNNPNITNQGTMTVTGYTTSGFGFRQSGTGIFNNTGTVNLNATLYTTTNPVTITNASGANFNLSGTTFTLASNTCLLNNIGTFKANNNSIVSVSGYQARIANSGTFYAGTSGSVCTLKIITQPVDQNTNASFYNTGTTYVGSTSLVTFSGCNYQATLNNAGRFVFQSDANGSAALDDMVTGTNSPSIKGSYDVERFFNGGGLMSNRGYRLLSSPVNQTSATISATNTFNLFYLNQHTYNSFSYAGAFTGGPAGVSGGFSGTSVAPTLYLYKETIAASNTSNYSGKHVGIIKVNATSVNTSNSADPSAVISNLSIPIGNGFLFYFVGPSSRTSGTSTIAPLDATMTDNGYINYGNFTVNLWYTPTGGAGYLSYSAAGAASVKGFNMVGNPYPCTLDFSKLYADNSANIDVIYMLSQRAGGSSQDYVAYSSSGSSSPAINNYAVSGAGFIVHVKSTAGTTATLQFKESQKASTTQVTGSSLMMSTPRSEVLAVDGKLGANGLSAAQQRSMALPLKTGEQPVTGLYMKMEKDSATFSYCGIYYREGYGAKYEDGDATYLGGATSPVSICSRTSDGVNTAINHLPDYHAGSRVWLNPGAIENGLYKLKLEGVRNIDTLYDIYLLDHFKKDSLDIRRYGSYAFNINNSDSSTFGPTRFELVIHRKPLPQYLLTNFDGNKVTEGVNLAWKTVNESNYTGFVLEKQNKTTGEFAPIYEKQSDGSAAYSFVDRTPYSGNNVYRLKQDDIDNKISYSQPVTIFYDKNAGSGNSAFISVFPNPTAEIINVSVPTAKATEAYKFLLYNASGNLVMQKTSNANNWSQNVSRLKTGAYIVEVLKSDGTPLGKSKFVKN